jgi:hypothetical protein
MYKKFIVIGSSSFITLFSESSSKSNKALYKPEEDINQEEGEYYENTLHMG